MAVYSSEFGDAVREAVGTTPYRTIAKRAGISAAYIGDMIQGRIPSRDVVLRFARGSGADVNRLLILAGFAPLPGDEGSSNGKEPAAEIAYEPVLDDTGIDPYAGPLAGLPDEDRAEILEVMRLMADQKRRARGLE